MAKLLVIGDTHCKPMHHKIYEEFVIKIQALAESELPNAIIFLGDDLDKPVVNSESYKIVIQMLLKLGKIAPVYKLIGNHERLTNVSGLNSVHPFTGVKQILQQNNVHIIDLPTVYEISDSTFGFIPYVPSGEYEEIEKLVVSASPELIFCHQEFAGVAYHGKETSVKDYPKFEGTTIAGHIHDYTRIGNVVYAGSPYQTNFGEISDKKVWVLENGQPPKPVSLGMPVFITIEASVEANIDISNKNAYYRVILGGSSSELLAFRRSPKYRELVSEGVKVVLNPTDTVIRKNREAISYMDLLLSRIKEDWKVTFEEIQKIEV